MAEKSKILITGGAGYIGSHVNQRLGELGYDTVVLDNLGRGDKRAVIHGQFVQGDIRDQDMLIKLFREHPINTVIHFAAFADVGESIQHPYIYYDNNVAGTLSLLNAMQQCAIPYLIFSSTAAIFGIPIELPVNENHPKKPINPYGHTKLMVEQILKDFENAHHIKHISLRYFNAAGGDPNMKIKNYKPRESNLIPLILRSLKKPMGSLTIFGTDYPTIDGTCVRDYIHVWDLADAHILAMKRLHQQLPSRQYNLGNGKGFTVKQVIDAVEQVTGKHVNATEGPRRPGDPPILIADSTLALKELGWKCQYSSLEAMIEHAWLALN